MVKDRNWKIKLSHNNNKVYDQTYMKGNRQFMVKVSDFSVTLYSSFSEVSQIFLTVQKNFMW